MTNLPLTPSDYNLIDQATAKVRQLFAEKKHNLACLMETVDGQQFLAINMQGAFGCVDVCAEQIALGSVLSAGQVAVATIVTVRHPKITEPDQTIKVASPCGKCRELLADYAPEALVIIRDGDHLFKTKASELLPARYSKT